MHIFSKILLTAIFSYPFATQAEQAISTAGKSADIIGEQSTGQNPQQAVRVMTVEGKVLDENNQPLPGASIVLTSTGRGVISDLDGNYQIKVPVSKNAQLRVSFVGMKTQVIAVNNNSHINIKLQPHSVAINEVVVEGAYGTRQKRSDQVGSAFQVNSERIQSLPPLRVDKILDSTVPGVTVDPNNDSQTARQRYNVRVRGDASMSASNEPLWIVDGTPIYTGDRTNQVTGMSYSVSPLSFINPEDIASMTVLKDASATSIYGANGANGVILITTKSGKSGDTRMNVDIRYGVDFVNQLTRFKVLNASEWMMLAKESYQNAGKDMKIFPFQDNEINSYSTTDTDWGDVYYHTGNTLQANLSLSGGNEKSKYYISGGYFDEHFTVIGNRQQRFSLRVNNAIKLHQKLTATINMSASYNINNLFSPSSDYYDILPVYSVRNADQSFRLWNRTVDGYNSDETLKWKDTRFLNSVAEREENDNRQRTGVVNANALLNYKILPGLELTTQFGADYQSAYEDMYSARTNWSGMSLSSGPYGYSTRRHANYLIWTNIDRLNYNQTFGKHEINGVAGFEISSKGYNTLGATGSSFVNDYIKEISYAVDKSGSSSQSTTRSLSYFLQGGYSYDKRYYLVVNGRRDGNSGFGKDSRWANFASIGASWNIHNESFFNNDIVNILKLKGSFGSNGNSRLGSQEAQGLYSYSQSNNYMGESGAAVSASANPGLSWETTYMANLGLRFVLFNRIDFDFEYYNNKTVDLLSNLDVSRTTGDTRVYRNVGKIRNQGFEFTIITDNLKNSPISWKTEWSASHNNNKLLELYNGIEKVMGNTIWREGYNINTYYIVRWAGVDPRDGAPLWYDKNGNITRVYDYNNRVPYKNSTPDLYGGLTNTFRWDKKGLQLQVFMKYEIGGYAFSSFGRGQNSDGLNIMSENQSVEQLDRWQKPGDLALCPKPLWGISTQSVMNSSRYLYKRTNLQIKNVVLSYDIPANWLKKMHVRSCKVNLIGDNLGIWTPYDKSNRNSYRTCMSGDPMQTSVSLGLNIGL